jgi:hypothetical protein
LTGENMGRVEELKDGRDEREGERGELREGRRTA